MCPCQWLFRPESDKSPSLLQSKAPSPTYNITCKLVLICHRLTDASTAASALAQAASDSHSRLLSSAAAALDQATTAEQLANELLQMRLQLQAGSRTEAGRR